MRGEGGGGAEDVPGVLGRGGMTSLAARREEKRRRQGAQRIRIG